MANTSGIRSLPNDPFQIDLNIQYKHPVLPYAFMITAFDTSSLDPMYINEVIVYTISFWIYNEKKKKL
jgi:hypothetical protein